MAKQDIPKKKRGRPPTGGRREGILVRLEPEQLSSLDSWADRQDRPTSRPEAIRRLVEVGLKTAPPTVEQINDAKSHAAQAAKLAAELGLKARK